MEPEMNLPSRDRPGKQRNQRPSSRCSSLERVVRSSRLYPCHRKTSFLSPLGYIRRNAPTFDAKSRAKKPQSAQRCEHFYTRRMECQYEICRSGMGTTIRAYLSLTVAVLQKRKERKEKISTCVWSSLGPRPARMIRQPLPKMNSLLRDQPHTIKSKSHLNPNLCL